MWCCALQTELLPQLLRVMDVKLMTGSEGQRKLMLGNATILAYCLRWPEFRVRASWFASLTAASSILWAD